MNQKLPKRILIEPMLFGDYCVAVYDQRDELLLDKKYFLPGLLRLVYLVQKYRKEKSGKICQFI